MYVPTIMMMCIKQIAHGEVILNDLKLSRIMYSYDTHKFMFTELKSQVRMS